MFFGRTTCLSKVLLGNVPGSYRKIKEYSNTHAMKWLGKTLEGPMLEKSTSRALHPDASCIYIPHDSDIQNEEALKAINPFNESTNRSFRNGVTVPRAIWGVSGVDLLAHSGSWWFASRVCRVLEVCVRAVSFAVCEQTLSGIRFHGRRSII